MSPSVVARKVAKWKLCFIVALVSILFDQGQSLLVEDKGEQLETNRIPHQDRRVNKTPSSVYPVILVPGDGGSQLEAKLDKPSTVHYFCDKKTNYFFDLWLNLELMVPYVLDCWVDNMRLVYDNVTRITTNAPGVEIRVPGFGNTTTVEWLDPSQVSPSAYFTSLVQNLTAIGLQRGISVRGAPYDFRKAPNELGGVISNLSDLVEDTYTKNDGQKVILVCHSMGCPLSLTMLNNQSQVWKDKYIRALVSMGAPWGGAVKAIKAFGSGDNLGVIVINSLTVREEQRSCPSTAFLMPSSNFWEASDPLVVTPEKNYTVEDYETFFNDIDFPWGWEMWKDTHNIIHDLVPPGVEVHCLHGIGVDTIQRLIYDKNKFPDHPNLEYGDGDGTVNLRSLIGCLRWQGKQKQKIFHQSYSNVDHMQILSNPDTMNYITRLAAGQ